MKKKSDEVTQVQRRKMSMNKYLSIITLNVNGLNAPVKRHKIAEWIRKHDPHMLPTRHPPQNKRSTQD